MTDSWPTDSNAMIHLGARLYSEIQRDGLTTIEENLVEENCRSLHLEDVGIGWSFTSNSLDFVEVWQVNKQEANVWSVRVFGYKNDEYEVSIIPDVDKLKSRQGDRIIFQKGINHQGTDKLPSPSDNTPLEDEGK